MEDGIVVYFIPNLTVVERCDNYLTEKVDYKKFRKYNNK